MTVPTTQLGVFFANVQAGQYDDNLGEIEEVVRQRRRIIKAKAVATIQPGDRVRITYTNIGPRYLYRAEAIVERVNPEKFTIRLETAARLRRFSGVQTTIPKAWVEKMAS